MLNRIRFCTIPLISSLRSSLKKGSPPWRVTLKTAHLFNSLKNSSHSSLGRSVPESPALEKWLQYLQRRLHLPVIDISTDLGVLIKGMFIFRVPINPLKGVDFQFNPSFIRFHTRYDYMSSNILVSQYESVFMKY